MNNDKERNAADDKNNKNNKNDNDNDVDDVHKLVTGVMVGGEDAVCVPQAQQTPVSSSSSSRNDQEQPTTTSTTAGLSLAAPSPIMVRRGSSVSVPGAVAVPGILTRQRHIIAVRPPTPDILVRATMVVQDDARTRPIVDDSAWWVAEAFPAGRGRWKWIALVAVLVILLAFCVAVIQVQARSSRTVLLGPPQDAEVTLVETAPPKEDNIFVATLEPTTFSPATLKPTTNPTFSPSTIFPSSAPTTRPSLRPSFTPSRIPSSIPSWQRRNWVSLSTLVSNGSFGQSVELSETGRVLAVGAHLADSINGIDSGVVRVLEYDGSWRQMGQNLNGNGQGGWALDLSANGTIVAVSSWTGGFVLEGTVRVYQYYPSVNLWYRLGQDLFGGTAGVFFGVSVSLSSDGMVLAVGADVDTESGSGVAETGSVKVFAYSRSQWIPLGNTLYGNNTNDHFGWDVSLSGNGLVLAVGSVLHDGPNGMDAGKVCLYRFNQTIWEPMGNELYGRYPRDGSGHAVSISHDGMTVAVGAYRHDGANNVTDAGHVRVYRYNNVWMQLGRDIVGEFATAGVGRSVSLSRDGTVLAVGNTPERNSQMRGSVRVYRYHGNNWQQIGDTIAGDTLLSGYSVSLASERVAVGVPDSPDGGRVKLYELQTP